MEPRGSKLESNMEEKEHEPLETDKNVNDDSQTTVRTRVNETKEISHKVFRTFVSDSKDSMSFVMPEYSELPHMRGKVVSNGQEDLTRVFSTDFIDHSPRSSREETKTRSVDRHERRYIPVTRISSSKPEVKSKDSDTVPMEEYENMKRQCELEIAYWKRMCNEIHNGGDQLLANEPLRRHIVNLEAELRDSKW
ncbi:unnamed protein product [Dicrocoelium dendriticum]|nr:unnamed protein product [Dicrocoelium dendriticum]